MRDVVADTLGVGTEDLSPGVSLTKDLAADSLDLADPAVALDAEFGILMSDGLLDHMRTCDEVVDAVDTLLHADRDAGPDR